MKQFCKVIFLHKYIKGEEGCGNNEFEDYKQKHPDIEFVDRSLFTLLSRGCYYQ